MKDHPMIRQNESPYGRTDIEEMDRLYLQIHAGNKRIPAWMDYYNESSIMKCHRCKQEKQILKIADFNAFKDDHSICRNPEEYQYVLSRRRGRYTKYTNPFTGEPEKKKTITLSLTNTAVDFLYQVLGGVDGFEILARAHYKKNFLKDDASKPLPLDCDLLEIRDEAYPLNYDGITKNSRIHKGS